MLGETESRHVIESEDQSGVVRGIAGFDGHRAPEGDDRRRQFAALEAEMAQVRVRGGAGRLERQRSPVARRRRRELPVVVESIAEIVVGLGIGRVELGRPSETADCFVDPVQPPERQPFAVERFCEVRTKRERPAVEVESLHVAPLRAASVRERMEGLRRLRHQDDRLSERPDGRSGATRSLEGDAQVRKQDWILTALRLENRQIGVGLLGMAPEGLKDRGEMVPRQDCPGWRRRA